MCIIYSGVYHLQIAVNCIIYRQTLCRLFLTVKSNLNQLAGELGGQLEIKRPELLSQSKSNVYVGNKGILLSFEHFIGRQNTTK